MEQMRSVVALLVSAVVLGGCQGLERWENRYGPEAAIEPEDLGQTMARQRKAMAYLAGLDDENANLYDPGLITSDDWYEITLKGFNYIDEKCDLYLHDVFIRRREASRITGVLNATDKASAAILAATSASQVSMQVLGQLFGLATGISNEVANSYLFKDEPSIVYGTAKKMRLAYRADVSKQYGPASGVILSEAWAYALIRGYLSQCMPEHIETEIKSYLAEASAKAKPPEKAPDAPKVAAADVRTPPPAAGSTPEIKLAP